MSQWKKGDERWSWLDQALVTAGARKMENQVIHDACVTLGKGHPCAEKMKSTARLDTKAFKHR